MIPLNQTNTVYYSPLSNDDYKEEIDGIRKILNENQIDFYQIDGTRNYLCREYMPVQKDENTLVQFTFLPDHMIKDRRLRKLISNPEEIRKQNSFLQQFQIVNCDLILDGRCLVHHKNTVLISYQVYFDNPGFHSLDIIKEIASFLDARVIFVPPCPCDSYGHIDSMVRFVDDHTVISMNLMRDIPEMRKWRTLLKRKLKNECIRLIEMPEVIEDTYMQHVYINYLEAGNVIILPFINKTDDDIMMKFFRKQFPDRIIHSVELGNDNEFCEFHGYTWNVLEPETNILASLMSK